MSMNDHFASKVLDRITRRKRHLTVKTWYRVPCYGLYKLPLEPILRIVVSLLFAVVCLSVTKSWTLFNSNGKVNAEATSVYELATIFVLFAVLGCAEVMESYTKLHFPHALPHVILSTIYMAIGLVHYQFAFDVDPIVKRHYQLLQIPVGLASIIAAIECFQMRNFAIGFAKCFFTILQGTWLFQISFACLGSKPWKVIEENEELIPLTFLWHVLGLFVMCFIVHCIMLCAVKWNEKKQNALYNGNQSRHKVDEESLPLGIVVHGNTLYSDDTSDMDTLYP